MIGHTSITGVKLDGICILGASLWAYQECEPDTESLIWKSDMSATYCQMPMHPLWQLKQNISIFGHHYVDCNNNLGGHRSQNIWASFISLILWISVFKREIKTLKCYIDDHFAFSEMGDISLYKHYHTLLPTNQTVLLILWDEINLPHKLEKQVSGAPLSVIGFDVDPNQMTASLSPTKQQKLIDVCLDFIDLCTRETPWDLQRLQGWVNWALNAKTLYCTLCMLWEDHWQEPPPCLYSCKQDHGWWAHMVCGPHPSIRWCVFLEVYWVAHTWLYDYNNDCIHRHLDEGHGHLVPGRLCQLWECFTFWCT